jgi:hypothetical protein
VRRLRAVLHRFHL